jgi:hypothetical protein
MKASVFIIISIINKLVIAHSALSCTNTIGKECFGFARYYNFNRLPNPLPSSDDTDTFYASRDREFQLQAGIDKICPELNAEEYTDDFPMATAVAGETITLQHPPRGHSLQPSSPVWIYMHPEPDKYPTTMQLPAEEFKLISEYPFDTCYGLDKEISWANCTGTITIPEDTEDGVYTFWWRWDLNSIPYSDCFELTVTSKPKGKKPRSACKIDNSKKMNTRPSDEQ